MKIKIKKRIVFGIVAAVVAGVVFSQPAKSYDNKRTHVDLTGAAVELYNRNHPENKISDKEAEWIRRGAKEEDEPASRCVNHFYNPTNGSAIVSGANTALDWVRNSGGQSVNGGDYTWDRAVYSYVDNDKEKAFLSLGHVLHLVQDMAVPAHVRGDHHLRGDLYEEWAMNNGKSQAGNIVSCSDLNNCLNNLAIFTNSNFLSQDSLIVSDIRNKKTERISKYFNGKNRDYLQASFESQEYILIQTEDDFLTTKYFIDDLVHADYWKVLSPKAAGYSARVIELFFEEVEKEKLTRQPKTVWNKITNSVKNIASLAYSAKEKVQSTAQNIVNSVTDAFKNVSTDNFRKILSHGQDEVLNEVLPKEEQMQAQNQKKEEPKGESLFMLNGEFVSKSADISLYKGETANIWARIKNTGIINWDKDQISLNITTPEVNGVREESPFYDSSWVTRLRPVSNREKVSSGDIISLGFTIKAPDKTGVFVFNLRPIYKDSSGFHWMGNGSVSWNITVKNPIVSSPQPQVQFQPNNPWTDSNKKAASLVNNIIEEKSQGANTSKTSQVSMPPANYGFFASSPANESGNNNSSSSNEKVEEDKQEPSEDESADSSCHPEELSEEDNSEGSFSNPADNSEELNNNQDELNQDESNPNEDEIEPGNQEIEEISQEEEDAEDPEPIYGCTDSEADNYQEEAEIDDGSCEYTIVGCMDENAENFNENANYQCADCCEYLILGCTDSSALNYSENANQDDGSCEYPISGCMDDTAKNYNSSAAIDDGSCVYWIYGCADSEADNYNSEAEIDDGSCEYSQPEPDPDPEPDPEPEPEPESEPEPEPEPEIIAPAYSEFDVVINEIAWAGTSASSADEWIELYNTTNNEINLFGWRLADAEDQLDLNFLEAMNPIIGAQSYYLIERSEDDNSISDIIADFAVSFAGGLKDLGEKLSLFDPANNIIDETDCASYGWVNYADKDSRISMERINPLISGSDLTNWQSNDTIHINGLDAGKDSVFNPILGTPRQANSSTYEIEDPEDQEEADSDNLEDNPDENLDNSDAIIVSAANTAVQVSDMAEFYRGYLRSAIYENKIYYTWTQEQPYKGGGRFRYGELAFGVSELDGANFQYRLIDTVEDFGGHNRQKINFIIYNNKAYFAWFEFIGSMSGVSLYDFFVSRADLSIIENGINESNYSRFRVTSNGNQILSDIDMQVFGGKIKIVWSGNEDKNITNSYGNKLAILNIDPNDFSLLPEIEALDPDLGGWEFEINSVIDGNKQYFVWGCGSLFSYSCMHGTLGWGSFDSSNQAWQSFYSSENVALSRSITIADGQPIIFWNNNNSKENILYTDFNSFIPRPLIAGIGRKIIAGSGENGGKTYLLYQEEDLAENSGNGFILRNINLAEFKNGTVENSFNYNIAEEDGSYLKELMSVSSQLIFSPAGDPIIAWIERNSVNKSTIYIMRVEF